MIRKLLIAVALATVGGVPTSARALSFAEVIVEDVVGAGENEAIIVVDWDTGTTPSHAWLFRWDGSATFADAYDAIEAAEGGAFDWSGGNFVSFIDYADGQGDVHVSTNEGWLSFWNSLDGETWDTNLVGVEEQLLVDGGWAGANANLAVGEFPGEAPSVPVPEPGSAALLGLGLAALARRSRRRA